MELSPIELKAHYSHLNHLHIKWCGKSIAEYNQLLSHGSERLIVRLVSENGSTSIGIFSRHIEENRAFINFGNHFKSCGINVPEIYSVSPSFDSYILEDLGDEMLLNRIQQNNSGGGFSSTNIELYKNVINELPKIQIEAGSGIDYSFCYQFKEFGEENIKFDLDYFTQRFLKNFYKEDIDPTKLEKDLSFITGKILEVKHDYFLYRDFQSRNIMLRGNEPWFIDFQSGRKGALLYDIASLLYDAKADIPQNTREELLDYYINVLKSHGINNADELKSHFWYFAIVRILQAMGAYGFLGIVKGKRRFLESIPYALKNINFILTERLPGGSLDYLKKIFSELLNEKLLQNEEA